MSSSSMDSSNAHSRAIKGSVILRMRSYGISSSMNFSLHITFEWWRCINVYPNIVYRKMNWQYFIYLLLFYYINLPIFETVNGQIIRDEGSTNPFSPLGKLTSFWSSLVTCRRSGVGWGVQGLQVDPPPS